LLHGRYILGKGRNRKGVINSYFRQHWNLKDTHAEVDAIIRSKRVSGDTIIVVRISKNKRLLNSKPCLSCQAIMKHFNIKKVYHSNAKGTLSRMDLI